MLLLSLLLFLLLLLLLLQPWLLLLLLLLLFSNIFFPSSNVFVSRKIFPFHLIDFSSHRKFLSDHDLSEVTLLGHSMGARAAMLLCLTDPSRVRDGISVDATPVHPTPRHGVDILREYIRALKKVRKAPCFLLKN